MTRRVLAGGLAVAVAFLGTGCFTVHHAYHGDKFLTNGPNFDQPTHIVRHFSDHQRQFFLLHGGIPMGKPLNGLALAAKEAGTHDGVVNLRLRDGQDLVDIGITHIACLLSVLCGSWSTWVSGDVADAVPASNSLSQSQR